MSNASADIVAVSAGLQKMSDDVATQSKDVGTGIMTLEGKASTHTALMTAVAHDIETIQMNITSQHKQTTCTLDSTQQDVGKPLDSAQHVLRLMQTWSEIVNQRPIQQSPNTSCFISESNAVFSALTMPAQCLRILIQFFGGGNDLSDNVPVKRRQDTVLARNTLRLQKRLTYQWQLNIPWVMKSVSISLSTSYGAGTFAITPSLQCKGFLYPHSPAFDLFADGGKYR